ncbi:MAG: alanine--tRNA ligase [Cyclobacteriaceae bacterium]|nr:alanine--tRNA ligase [Cyclobacteriaceae bacterium]
MNATEIRAKFLDFFEQKGHKIVASAPLVVKDDPTLMFTNAGMNQFKDYFLGNKKAENTRVTDTQKCLRVSGKHNDLEEVGIDTYHHTMFEMLGNWSFGDYFKQEAIEFAWELLTKVFELPKERLYASYFGGDVKEKMAADEEAKALWGKILPEDHILSGSKSDNFWEMGETGPCGPCSELHIDMRPQSEIDKIPGKDLVNQDHPQVIEIWNLVFIQFNRLANGTLENLPDKHVDTGMGFERLVRAIQGKTSNYDTDVFQPMIQHLATKANVSYGQNEQTDIALRVIVDHIRAITFAISDGQLPSNNGAGYVIRRILRRAVRYGFQFLDFKQPFLGELLPLLEKQFGSVFPELKSQADFIKKVITEEETGFLRTLDSGLKKIDEWISESENFAENWPKTIKENNGGGKPIFSGHNVFTLYDTFGIPKDLTLLILREKGKIVYLDKTWEEDFERNLLNQKTRSRKDAVKETGDWVVLKKSIKPTDFVGYDHLETNSNILRYRIIKQKGKDKIQVVLDKTPFYAESGGQVGDSGILVSANEKIRVIDTQKENDLIVHFVDKLPQNLDAEFESKVDSHKRLMTVNNHSATHLMHAALRQVLGKHVEQRGSLVNEKQLRFDFSHFAKLTTEEIKEIEQIVNKRIRENISLNVQANVPIKKAKELGAMALFGEKYGEFVRVITFDKNYSVELCGGTHVKATGQIGLFKIVSESSVASGIRRIEAITAEASEQLVLSQEGIMQEVKEVLKNPKDIVSAVQSVVEEKNKLTKQLEAFQKEQVQNLKADLKAKAERGDGMTRIIAKVSLPNGDALKQLAHDLKREEKGALIIIAADIAGKPQIAVAIDESLVAEKNLNAGQIVRDLAKNINGGGGGQPFFATAGGSKLEGLDDVVNQALTLV